MDGISWEDMKFLFQDAFELREARMVGDKNVTGIGILGGLGDLGSMKLNGSLYFWLQVRLGSLW